jgi:hypothetical protein
VLAQAPWDAGRLAEQIVAYRQQFLLRVRGLRVR